MTIEDITDKLIEVSDFLQRGTLKGPDGTAGYFGLVLENVRVDQLNVAIMWFEKNIPNLINIYEVDGQKHFQIRDGRGPTGKYIIYLYKTE